jgi:hypothetical protein
MAIYTKTAKQMLVDLINEGNPNLPFPINDTDFDFTLPETITDPGNGHNTKIRVIAKPNTNYIGNIVVTYRRLNVGFLFRNMTLEVQKWVANSGQASGNLIQIDTLLPLYSEKYGIPFTVGEWTNAWLTGYNGIRGDAFTLSPTSSNLVFIGTIQAKWFVGERTLESLLPVDVMGGRLYPGGNNLDDPAHKYWVTPDSFNMDFTEHKDILRHTYINGYFLGYNNSSIAPFQRQFITDVLSKVVPREHPLIDKTNYVADTSVSTSAGIAINQAGYGYKVAPLGLGGLQPTLYTLPHPHVPEANSEFFNRVLVFTLPDDCPWGAGKLYFHFNV